MQDSKVHSFFAGCQPTAFRLQGLVTLLTAFSLRTLAGFFSHRQRSWDSPLRSFTSRQVSSRFRLKAPTYRSTCRCSQRQDAGPARQASVPGLCPCRGLRMAIGGFSTATIGSSLGVPPSRASHEGLDLAFTWSPLSHFVNRITNDSADRCPRVSINPRLAQPWQPVTRLQWLDNPSRVPAPALNPVTFRRASHPGYVFPFRCVVHYCRPPNSLWMS